MNLAINRFPFPTLKDVKGPTTLLDREMVTATATASLSDYLLLFTCVKPCVFSHTISTHIVPWVVPYKLVANSSFLPHHTMKTKRDQYTPDLPLCLIYC